MKYIICQVSVAPLRAEDSDRSEMVSQLIFGEKAIILESRKNWIKITSDYDSYTGWVDSKQFLEVTEKEYHSIQNEFYASETFNLAVESDTPITLPFASHLPNLKDGKFTIGSKTFDYLSDFRKGDMTKSELTQMALLYLNVPYVWGGKSVFGIDCSGFVQQLYKMAGVKLPRDAYQQAEIGEPLSFIEEAEPGDLAFFDNSDGKIIHVGMIIEDNKIIHAHGKVRIDPIDTTGIFNTDSQSYSHKLRVIKKILGQF